MKGFLLWSFFSSCLSPVLTLFVSFCAKEFSKLCIDWHTCLRLLMVPDVVPKWSPIKRKKLFIVQKTLYKFGTWPNNGGGEAGQHYPNF